MDTHKKDFGISPLVVLIVYLVCSLLIVTNAQASTKSKCGKYDSVSVTANGGNYRVSNNIWNGSSRSQCIEVDDRTGAFAVTASSHRKPTDGAPASYAFIAVGCHWNECTDSGKNGLPRKVSSVSAVSSSWSTIQPEHGVYNVAYDIWFSRTSRVTGQPDGAEMMIWLARNGNIQPVGSRVAEAVRLDDATWDVWYGWNGKNNVISYVRTSNTDGVDDLDLKAFIADAADRKFIQTSWYVTSIEAGFEIWQGSAGLASNSFSVNLN